MQQETPPDAEGDGTGFRGMDDPLALDRFLPYRLSIVAGAVSQAFATHYERRFGITIAEWRILAVLGERSPQSTRDIIRRTRMDKVKVSRAAIRLEQRELIIREKPSIDQRTHLLRLSGSGATIYRQVVPLADALQSSLVRGLDPAERTALDTALNKLLDCADRLLPDGATQGDPPPPMEAAEPPARFGPGVDGRLVVYGTLAPGEINHHEIADAGGTWFEGSVRGHLVAGGWGSALGFPGLVPDPRGPVLPVRLLVSEALPFHLARLDAFEGDGYARVPITCTVQGFQVQAWIYALADQGP